MSYEDTAEWEGSRVLRLRSGRLHALRPTGLPYWRPTVRCGGHGAAGGGAEREAEFAHSHSLGFGGPGGEGERDAPPTSERRDRLGAGPGCRAPGHGWRGGAVASPRGPAHSGQRQAGGRIPGCGCRGSSGKRGRGPGSGLAAVTRRGAPRGSLGCGLSGRRLGQAAAGNRVRGRLSKVTGRARKGSRASRGRAHPLPRAQVRPAARGAAFAASQPGRAPWEPSRSHSSSQRHGSPAPVPVPSQGGTRSTWSLCPSPPWGALGPQS